MKTAQRSSQSKNTAARVVFGASAEFDDITQAVRELHSLHYAPEN